MERSQNKEFDSLENSKDIDIAQESKVGQQIKYKEYINNDFFGYLSKKSLEVRKIRILYIY